MDKKNQDPTPLRLAMQSARKAAQACSRSYLREARYGSTPQTKRDLEAIAVNRAVAADLIDQIGRERFTGYTQDEDDGIERLSIDLADANLIEACNRLYRLSEDASLRSFVRDLKKSVAGLALNALVQNRAAGG